MKKIFSSIAVLAVALLFASCEEKPAPDVTPEYDIVPVLASTPEGVNVFDAASGILSVKAQGTMTGDLTFADANNQDVSGITFKAKVPAEDKIWCVASCNKSRLILTVSKNTADSPRQTSIVVTADLDGKPVGDCTITVMQDAAEAQTPGGNDQPIPSGPEITHFLIPGMIECQISYPTITVKVPAGTDVTALAPTILTSEGSTVNPASGVAQDFTQVIEYTVTETATQISKKYYAVVTTVATGGGEVEVETNPIYKNFEMVTVGAGSFMIGRDPAGKFADKTNTHKVNISAFEIGKYEVTQREFLEVMGYNPSTNVDSDLYPVHKVTLYEAMEYCNKLSLKNGYTPVYTFSEEKRNDNGELLEAEVDFNKSANGYRIPTNAEWEYAAKGGPNNRDYTYHYPGGDDLNDVAWWEENSAPSPMLPMQIHVVGLKKPNSLGIYDLAGNAEEWTGEWYISLDYMSDAEETDPWGPKTYRNIEERYVIVRGGCWDSYSSTCMITQWRIAGAHVKTDMSMGGGEIWWDQLGFRVARSLKD